MITVFCLFMRFLTFLEGLKSEKFFTFIVIYLRLLRIRSFRVERVSFMRKMEISNTNVVNRITVEKAIEIFLRNCLVKNLSAETQKYYKENCNLFNSLVNVTYIDEVNSEQLGICLDTGHLHLANAQGKTAQSQREFIVKAGRRLKALHIANNNGICDLHLLPFNCSHGIHWDEVVRALIDVGYNGIFNLEISGEHSSVTCPDKVREIKLVYIRKLLDYMLSEEFISRK